MKDNQQIENLLSDLTIQNALDKIDVALDIQIQTIEEWCSNDRFDICDTWLQDNRIFTLNNEIILNTFIATKPWRNYLKNRDYFFKKTKKHFEKTLDKERINIIERVNYVKMSN